MHNKLKKNEKQYTIGITPRSPARIRLTTAILAQPDWGKNKAVFFAGVAKLVTAIDSKSIGGNPLGVQVSPPAQWLNLKNQQSW